MDELGPGFLEYRFGGNALIRLIAEHVHDLRIDRPLMAFDENEQRGVGELPTLSARLQEKLFVTQ